MPATAPSKLARNFTPSSKPPLSPASIVGGVANSKMVATGVTAEDAADSGLVPTSFVAVTRKRYCVPLSRPVIVVAVAVAPTVTGSLASPPTYGITVCLVIALSPSLSAAVHATRADFVAGSACTSVGEVGATGLEGVTALVSADAGPTPFVFIASTLNR